jgi:hypothetical protein
VVTIGVIIGLALLFINFFLKSRLIAIANGCLFFWLFQQMNSYEWLQLAFLLIMLYNFASAVLMRKGGIGV